MKKVITFYYKNTYWGFYLLRPVARFYQFFLHKKYLSPQAFTKQRFKKKFGYPLDLDNPKTLNEKIHFLKLYYTHPLATQIADKYAVRSFIQEKLGKDYLVPLAYTTTNPKNIIPENLPDYPCIIKTNHNSSGGIMIRDKNANHNWAQIQSTLRWNLSENFYWDGRERQYKNIAPRIVVEKLLLDKSGNTPADYKVHCFNGKVRMINVDIGRSTENHYRNWYNASWEREPYKWTSELMNDKETNPSKEDVPKPENLDKIKELSEFLSSGFPLLRVDWYINEGRLYFGELTFHHNGGFRPIVPTIWDNNLGSELKLFNIKNP
ncbi:ATP-grasp fold amidoligase family protein [Maribacter sp. HTCC2170]|uniref:ATP-grasp fold amidoligase family protein n=1 Tax=Maribacter sp. (strain HTCC2170 / KCCM 42371) TaxID=313603 RepID=UPI00006B49AD|nr:ATP-grasp fold amidoligase family protein [Maribacter sp. HTCC2170]EAR01095.1 glycosyltransferase [Maribacter sp. HTCC2170]